MRLVNFAENLRAAIEAGGFKLTTISEGTGIPLSTLSEWTAGREPKVSEALVKLSQFLGLSLDQLVMNKSYLSNQSEVVGRGYIQVGEEQFQLVMSKKGVAE